MPTVTTRDLTAPTHVGPTETHAKVSQTTEVPAQGAAEETKQDAGMSEKFASLARKEKGLREMQKQIKAEQEALKAQKAEYDTNYIPKNRLMESPYKTLTEMGIDYDKITQEAIANLNSQDPIAIKFNEMQAKIAELEAAQANTKKQYEESQTQAYQAALKQIASDVKLLVETDANYETIKEMNAQEAVVKLIEAEFNETGEILTIEKAAAEVEDYLLDQAMKMARLKKVQGKLTPQEPPQNAIQQLKSMSAAPKTLTNSVGTSTKPMTPKERAILAFQGKLG